MRAAGKDRGMNALTLLQQDHSNVERLFERFEQLPATDVEDRRAVVDKIIEQLSVHAAIEEQAFYPAVREAIPDAVDQVLEGIEEHHVLKWTLSELEDLAPTDERFDPKMRVLMESVRHHVEDEENELFPKVRDALTVQQLEEMGDTLHAAKEGAPTRPHPRIPDTPPLNVLFAVPSAVLDRAVRTGKDAVERVLRKVS
jgi:hemerythrin superfamily protein